VVVVQGTRARRVLALALGLALVLGAVGVVAPAEARPSPGPAVHVQSASWLAPDGGTITVQVLASCPERWSVVEAVVAVSQPQASGQASFPLTCIGSLRMFTVAVPSAGGTFVLGEALVTASVTIQRGRIQSTQESLLVQVQPAVFVELGDTARIEDGGAAIRLDVVVACPVGASGVESLVGVTQGQAVSGTGAYVPVCDGSPHTFSVLVAATRGAYAAGDARALTFAIVEHGGFGFAGVDDGPVLIVN
jgi:hypothetical protein